MKIDVCEIQNESLLYSIKFIQFALSFFPSLKIITSTFVVVAFLAFFSTFVNTRICEYT